MTGDTARARSSAPPVPAPIDEAAERRAFEEWLPDKEARSFRFDADGRYLDFYIRQPWSAWLARARLAPDNLATLRTKLATAREALGWFLADDRFQVAVGGNPNAVERMLNDARKAYEDTAI